MATKSRLVRSRRRPRLLRGYVQVYTGDGKGKTTAALGLALRAVGAGLRVYIGQFLKRAACGGVRVLRERCPEVEIETYGTGAWVRGKPSAKERRAARVGLRRAGEAVSSGRYDVVILDEANVAVSLGLFAASDLLALIARKPARVELVLTGRGAPAALLERADLATAMKSLRHYFARGVRARAGIEK